MHTRRTVVHWSRRVRVVVASALVAVGACATLAGASSSRAALAAPAPLHSFVSNAHVAWRGVGRPVHGARAVYVTSLRMPDGPPRVAGIAWMNTRLLAARLYSGSLSPGGVAWHFSAPIAPSAARTLAPRTCRAACRHLTWDTLSLRHSAFAAR